jgi:hypothetical protein
MEPPLLGALQRDIDTLPTLSGMRVNQVHQLLQENTFAQSVHLKRGTVTHRDPPTTTSWKNTTDASYIQFTASARFPSVLCYTSLGLESC